MRPVSRLFVFACVCVLSLGSATSSLLAAPSGAVETRQEIYLDSNDNVVDENGDAIGYRTANLYVDVRRGVDLGTTTPTAVVRAYGYSSVWYFDGEFEFLAFPPQDIDPSAVTSDPIGNTMTLTTVLFENPDAQTGPHLFHLTLTKPTGTFIEHPDTHNPGVNAWATTGGQAGANASPRTGVRRHGYTVVGIFADDPFTSGPGTFASTFNGLVGTPAVSVP